MKTNYPLSGTFIDDITYDIPASNWTREQWAKDLDYMSEVGIDTLVFIRGGFNGRTIFPSEHFFCWSEDDFVAFIMQEAEKRDMQVYLGLYLSNINWNDGDYRTEINENKYFIAEAMKRYKDYSSFKGWYVPHETNCNSGNIAILTKCLASMCKDAAPDKKVLLSPFFKSPVTGQAAFSKERFFDEWDDVYAGFNGNVDICAFQDGTAPLGSMGDYFGPAKELCNKYGISLWSNVETFERDVRHMYYPIGFDHLRSKIKETKPYVEKFITFEFSHFLSPQSIYPSARNLFNLYKDYYGRK